LAVLPITWKAVGGGTAPFTTTMVLSAGWMASEVGEPLPSSEESLPPPELSPAPLSATGCGPESPAPYPSCPLPQPTISAKAPNTASVRPAAQKPSLFIDTSPSRPEGRQAP
jgi:hypothetical protein